MVDYATWPGVKRGKLGLILPDDFPFEGWEWWGQRICKLRDNEWALGDWLAFGRRKFGTAKNAYKGEYNLLLNEIASAGRSRETMRSLRYTAERVDFSLRREDIPPSYYRAVAPLAHEEQQLLIGRARRSGMGQKRPGLRKAVKQQAVPRGTSMFVIDTAGADGTKIHSVDGKLDATIYPNGRIYVTDPAGRTLLLDVKYLAELQRIAKQVISCARTR